MSDLSSQINSILQNPGAMEKIKELSGLLGQGADNGSAAGYTSGNTSAADNSSQINDLAKIVNALQSSGAVQHSGTENGGSPQIGDLGGITNALQGGGNQYRGADNGASISQISSLAGIINTLQRGNDSRQERLLEAIKPFLSEQRREKLEQAERILRVIRIIPILKNSGILNML